MPTSVRELYEVWAGDSELGEELSRSLDPRGVDWLFDAFRALGPKPGDVVLDAGARDAKHAIRLVSELGVRAVALDPLPLHCELARERIAEAGPSDEIDVVEGALEELPFEDASFDWIWCRDVLVHVDVEPGLRRRARPPAGRRAARIRDARDRSLEPRERAGLTAALALRTLDAAALEAAAGEAELELRSIDRLGSEWREAMIEEASWRVGEDLLQLARLRRREAELVERYGAATVDAAAGGSCGACTSSSGSSAPPSTSGSGVRNGVAHSLLDLIGDTPLVELGHFSPKPSVRVYAKLEGHNPTGSIKDRVAKAMLDGADLEPGARVIEPTSGNTGISLALICKLRGYRLTCVMPENATDERKRLLGLYGAEIVYSPGDQGSNGAVRLAQKLAEEDPGSSCRSSTRTRRTRARTTREPARRSSPRSTTSTSSSPASAPAAR